MTDSICRAVRKVRRVTRETDPFRICDDLRIVLLRISMGTDPDAVKGFFIFKRKVKVIVVNADLPEIMQRVVVAHEIGHAQLHAHGSVQQYHDFGMFRGGSVAEEEATMFAAELLLTDEDVLEAFQYEPKFFRAAASLYVPPELLDFKLRSMKDRGYTFAELPIHAGGNFLKDAEIPYDMDM